MISEPNIIVSCSEEFLNALSSKNPESASYIAERTNLSSNDFLAHQPTGCYFVARTLGQKSIVNFQSYLNRLLNNIKIKSFDSNHEVCLEASDEPFTINQRLEPLRDPNILFPLIKSLCKVGIKSFIEGVTVEMEAKLAVLLSYDRGTRLPIVKLHVSPLITPKGSTCEVEVSTCSRPNPEIKDSQWVRDRRELEKSMGAEVNEVLLMDSVGRIYEGMSSNFYTVVVCGDGPQIWTSPLEYVLRGTVMEMIIDGCKQLKIPLVYKFPNIRDALAGSWSGAFITSTSRLVLPIEKLHLRGPQAASITLHAPNDEPYIKALKEHVKAHLEAHAVRLL